MVDTHTHIYLDAFQNDSSAMIQRSLANGINTWLLPAIDSSTHQTMIDFEVSHPGAQAMMGLHPCSVTGDYENELASVTEWFSKRSFIGIGECGLDFHWDKTFVTQQYQAFRWQLQLGLEKDLPVIIHSREAMDECIAVVAEFPGVRTLFHCFNGTIHQGEAIRKMGGFLGIGGVLTYKNSGMDKVMAELGLQNVVLETDAPYLSPVPFRGKRNEPSYITYVNQKLAEVCQLQEEETATITTANARALFRIN